MKILLPFGWQLAPAKEGTLYQATSEQVDALRARRKRGEGAEVERLSWKRASGVQMEKQLQQLPFDTARGSTYQFGSGFATSAHESMFNASLCTPDTCIQEWYILVLIRS